MKKYTYFTSHHWKCYILFLKQKCVISNSYYSVSYPDCVVLAAGDDPPSCCSQHRDRLVVSALHRARQLAADHVLTAVTWRGRHATSYRGTCRRGKRLKINIQTCRYRCKKKRCVVSHPCTAADPEVSLSQQWRSLKTHWDELLRFWEKEFMSIKHNNY